jgi:hypothetical protein
MDFNHQRRATILETIFNSFTENAFTHAIEATSSAIGVATTDIFSQWITDTITTTSDLGEHKKPSIH